MTKKSSSNSFGFINGDLTYSDGSRNRAAEPQIRADADGNFYISSERGLGAGTDVWKSTDGGKTYQYLGQPNAILPGISPGGGDTDVAIATERNTDGFYNVYVTSLSLIDIDVSMSPDRGTTWITNFAAATIPLDDRPWIAAYGRDTVYLSYHDIITGNINVNRSNDAGATFTQLGEAINPQSNSGVEGANNNNQIGNIVVDPTTGTVYQIFVAANGLAENTSGAPLHVVFMAVSTDGGKTFNNYTVYNGPKSASYDHQFPNVALDRSGTVYAVFSDDHNIYYSYSTDHGKTWSKPHQINQKPSITSIEPWTTGGINGRIGVVWYGTSGTVSSGTAATNNVWYVYYALIQDANTNSPIITQVQATPIVHRGGVCESGIACGPNDNRDLFDDFGIAVNPLSGYVSIAYTDDQPNNSPQDTRTRYATQTKGPGLFS